MVFHACIIKGNFGQEEYNNLKEYLKQHSTSSVVLLKQKGDLGIIHDESPESLQRYSSLAKELSIYLAPGIVHEKINEKLYKTALMFGPTGEIVLKQQQLFPSPEDVKKGFGAGNMVKIARTEYGNIGFIVGDDCWHPEVGRFLALEGVDLVLAFNEIERGNYWRQLAGIWSQVQQNQFFALEASRGGRDLIHAPCEITPYRSGILAPVGDRQIALGRKPDEYLEHLEKGVKSAGSGGYKVTPGWLDLNRLKEIRRTYPLLKHLNPVLYQKSGLERLFAFQGGSKNES